MFTFTESEWQIIRWTDFEASAQFSRDSDSWPLTPEEGTYYWDTVKRTFSAPEIAKIYKRFAIQLTDFEPKGYYEVCTGLDWDDAHNLLQKMKDYLISPGS